ncbi:alpha-1,4-glucan--maltose-1-phosphate maltosyltransferase [Desulfonatronum parangueonense]
MQQFNGRRRIVIEHVRPEIEEGMFAAKRVAGEDLLVRADIFTDGHDLIQARMHFRPLGAETWEIHPMKPLPNDLWEARVVPEAPGEYEYTLDAWVDHFGTVLHGIHKKLDAGQDVSVDLLIAASLLRTTAAQAEADGLSDKANLLQETAAELEKGLAAKHGLALLEDPLLQQAVHACPDPELITTYPRVLRLYVERPKALYSTWYELFPRSWSPEPDKHGTLRDVVRLLPEIAKMGFDVLYLPPIHPIGRVNRKGKNNATDAQPGDPGSPWAIGAEEGGHTALHPELGTWDDFDDLVTRARSHGLEIALDLAYQCAPDHPYVRDHPDWFQWRPDGTVQYAENPPKKYQDVLPFHFETHDWENLWQELADVVRFWINKGILIFRVDNPHTKPFAFWHWLIATIRKEQPDVIFLAEAFTRPRIMGRLGKLGFSQSYTYFTWRNTKYELTEYMTELTRTDMRDYFRPNFWPNTPDILPEYLQYGGRPAFVIRLILAATLSSSYGIYGPTFELCVAEAVPGKEEYLHSEKYECRQWNWDQPGNLKELITRVNRIRRGHVALHRTDNLLFVPVNNDSIICYLKYSADGEDTLLIVVTLDPFQPQTGQLNLPMEELGLTEGRPFLLFDELTGERFIWQSRYPILALNPHSLPARILSLKRTMKREQDFDYFL